MSIYGVATSVNSALSKDKVVESKTSSRLIFADSLRGLAAFWVVLYHMAEGQHLLHLQSVIPATFNQVIFSLGHLGVAVFFVLSGFTMTFTVNKAIVDFNYSTNFLVRRLVRLTPPYYFALIFTITMAYIKAITLHQAYIFPGFLSLLSHLAYLQGVLGFTQINIVYWTLCVEIQFYVAFISLFWISDKINIDLRSKRVRPLIVMACLAISLLFPIGLWVFKLSEVYFLSYWYSFLAGVLACMGWQQHGRVTKLTIILTVIILFIGVLKHASFAITVAITALLLLYAGRYHYMNRWLNWKWTKFLALISYSLYLLHNPITGASFRIFNMFLPENAFSELSIAVITLCICFMISWIVYILIEAPSILFTRKIKLT